MRCEVVISSVKKASTSFLEGFFFFFNGRFPCLKYMFVYIFCIGEWYTTECLISTAMRVSAVRSLRTETKLLQELVLHLFQHCCSLGADFRA